MEGSNDGLLLTGTLLQQRLTTAIFSSSCVILGQFVDRCQDIVGLLESKASVSKQLSVAPTKVPDSLRCSRRSARQFQEHRKQKHFKAVLDGSRDLVQLSHCPIKGRSVIACQEFLPGDLVIEYCGELVNNMVAKRREEDYATDDTTGCFMFFFKFNEKWLCVDATMESDHLGRIINHSSIKPNLKPRLIVIKGKPRIFFSASSVIAVGEELLYDYGDRSVDAVVAFPWLKLS